ncbi:prevent-host-death protein [Ruania zhangjianzhongii]|uniref:prevent-host-death protein n=1 Tax=Ruania zhangjianzhongii TaxID=2603206 RepID=UPI0011C8CA5A|nr:prevent-host-death protein [Ruania zhangjianzhongii]
MDTSARVTRHFPSYTHTREHLRDVLDAAGSGLVTSVTRGSDKFVVVRAEQQRRMLSLLRPADAQVVAEGGGWAVIFPGLPVHGDAETFDGAVDDALGALREYAEAWNDHLHTAPNHVDNRAVVELIELSSDGELRAWVLGGEEPRVEAGA